MQHARCVYDTKVIVTLLPKIEGSGRQFDRENAFSPHHLCGASLKLA
jgi:hypothetical protein